MEIENAREELHARKGRIFDDDLRVGLPPWVLIESPAKHISEFRPIQKRRRSHVRGDESFTVVMNKFQQIGLLLCIDRDLTMPQKENRIHVRQARPTARE